MFRSVLFLFYFTGRQQPGQDRTASSDKNVEPHSAPQKNPPEDPFGSVPFVSHPGKLHL